MDVSSSRSGIAGRITAATQGDGNEENDAPEEMEEVDIEGIMNAIIAVVGDREALIKRLDELRCTLEENQFPIVVGERSISILNVIAVMTSDHDNECVVAVLRAIAQLQKREREVSLNIPDEYVIGLLDRALKSEELCVALIDVWSECVIVKEWFVDVILGFAEMVESCLARQRLLQFYCTCLSLPLTEAQVHIMAERVISFALVCDDESVWMVMTALGGFTEKGLYVIAMERGIDMYNRLLGVDEKHPSLVCRVLEHVWKILSLDAEAVMAVRKLNFQAIVVMVCNGHMNIVEWSLMLLEKSVLMCEGVADLITLYDIFPILVHAMGECVFDNKVKAVSCYCALLRMVSPDIVMRYVTGEGIEVVWETLLSVIPSEVVFVANSFRLALDRLSATGLDVVAVESWRLIRSIQMYLESVDVSENAAVDDLLHFAMSRIE